VTDGEHIYIATHILETDGNKIWIFSGMTGEEAKNFKVSHWMELPKPRRIESEPKEKNERES
jgi:hypothetical protein